MTFISPRFQGNPRLDRAAANSPTMKYGEHSPAVAVVQQALLELEYPFFDSIGDDGFLDGKFGPETKEVVKEFQRSLPNPLNDDGIIGHDTMEKLDQAVAAGIPHRPTGDIRMKRLVTHAFAGHELTRLNVNRLGFNLNSHVLAKVAGAVIDDLIQVKHDPSMEPGDAEYDSQADAFKFGFRGATTPSQRALIVHEAVHAAMDMQPVKGLIKSQSEAIAYVAQCYYMYLHSPDPKEQILLTTSKEPQDQEVYRLAWYIADKLHEDQEVKDIEWTALETTFYRHSEYAEDASTACIFNGLKRAV